MKKKRKFPNDKKRGWGMFYPGLPAYFPTNTGVVDTSSTGVGTNLGEFGGMTESIKFNEVLFKLNELDKNLIESIQTAYTKIFEKRG